ncbi:uncharacterized protein MONBRDRAFT_23148 [Monosiga brevicollis MX1]|uniref:Uncharacterized protein n=1 Tax=Monosiga brevicollis TaxID=81824 RepID=A9URB6_MONBE|nr:uncharacterized protein MONBRDRAFT_23148 [Monosiga brevicollis MX1]EDQ92213.1 predicted protein [Monosiga brevicollis MX1]|eukprot:XP_001743499.1 hypothetical protein [Monosiga brevicollis MX1]
MGGRRESAVRLLEQLQQQDASASFTAQRIEQLNVDLAQVEREQRELQQRIEVLSARRTHLDSEAARIEQKITAEQVQLQTSTTQCDHVTQQCLDTQRKVLRLIHMYQKQSLRTTLPTALQQELTQQEPHLAARPEVKEAPSNVDEPVATAEQAPQHGADPPDMQAPRVASPVQENRDQADSPASSPRLQEEPSCIVAPTSTSLPKPEPKSVPTTPRSDPSPRALGMNMDRPNEAQSLPTSPSKRTERPPLSVPPLPSPKRSFATPSLNQTPALVSAVGMKHRAPTCKPEANLFWPWQQLVPADRYTPMAFASPRLPSTPVAGLTATSHGRSAAATHAAPSTRQAAVLDLFRDPQPNQDSGAFADAVFDLGNSFAGGTEQKTFGEGGFLQDGTPAAGEGSALRLF